MLARTVWNRPATALEPDHSGFVLQLTGGSRDRRAGGWVQDGTVKATRKMVTRRLIAVRSVCLRRAGEDAQVKFRPSAREEAMTLRARTPAVAAVGAVAILLAFAAC